MQRLSVSWFQKVSMEGVGPKLWNVTVVSWLKINWFSSQKSNHPTRWTNQNNNWSPTLITDQLPRTLEDEKGCIWLIGRFNPIIHPTFTGIIRIEERTNGPWRTNHHSTNESKSKSSHANAVRMSFLFLANLVSIVVTFALGISIGIYTQKELGLLGWVFGGLAALAWWILSYSVCYESYCACCLNKCAFAGDDRNRLNHQEGGYGWNTHTWTWKFK